MNTEDRLMQPGNEEIARRSAIAELLKDASEYAQAGAWEDAAGLSAAIAAELFVGIAAQGPDPLDSAEKVGALFCALLMKGTEEHVAHLKKVQEG